MLQEPLRTFAGELIRLTRAYTSLDDLEHYQTTRLTVPFRAALVELGRHLVQHGALDDAEDVFFLQRAAIEDYLSGVLDSSTLLDQARAAKREHTRQQNTTAPHILGESEAEIAEGVLRGLPGSAGIAEGPVRLVHSAADFADFTPGSVLVARTTNPAWTPLFYSACAVVTESGGPLSHGAVTARELGIPAVMAVDRALQRLAPGTRVRVDGARGTVVVVAP
jgi:pyruvate,water dikinase